MERRYSDPNLKSHSTPRQRLDAALQQDALARHFAEEVEVRDQEIAFLRTKLEQRDQEVAELRVKLEELRQPLPEVAGVHVDEVAGLKERESESAFVAEGGGIGTPLFVSDEKKLVLIKGIPCFSGLDEEALDKLARSFEVKRYSENNEIVRANDERVGMHIIVQGRGRVSAVQEVGVLNPGEAFGEHAMLNGTAPGKCIEACDGELITLRLDPQVFRELDIKRKMMVMTKEKREVMRGRDDHSNEGRALCCSELVVIERCHPATDADRELIMEAVRSNCNFQEVLTLSQHQCEMMAEVAIRKEFAKGEVIFKKGDKGDAFYIVQEGVFKKRRGEDKRSDQILRSGDSFGDLALLYDAPRTSTVQCIRDGVVWMFLYHTFKAVLSVHTAMRNKHYHDVINSVPLLQELGDEEKETLCDTLDKMVFSKGEDVIRQGELGDCFHCIVQGRCEVIIDGEVKRELRTGDFFGEKALLQDEPCFATVRVTSELCTVLAVDPETFKLLHRKSKSREWSIEKTTDAQPEKLVSPSFIARSNLERVGLLGQGALGFVTLERDRETKRLFALKTMSKGQIVKERIKDHVKNEVGCMQLLHSKFIVQLCCTYRDDTSIYLLLEPCFGGDLLDIYNGESLWGSVPHAHFYAGSAACGLEHMHDRNIIYRDLKFANCLVTSAGHMKLTDMGLAKVVIGKTYTRCGTPDFLAPEILRHEGYNRAVDWWALGVLIFIMMTCESPFDADHHEDEMQIYKNIISGIDKVSFPADMPVSCKNIISQLCETRPEKRLTMKSGGVKNLRGHAWFLGFDWQALADGEMETPWSPRDGEEVIVARIAAKPKQELPQFDDVDDGTDWDSCFDWRLAHGLE